MPSLKASSELLLIIHFSLTALVWEERGRQSGSYYQLLCQISSALCSGHRPVSEPTEHSRNCASVNVISATGQTLRGTDLWSREIVELLSCVGFFFFLLLFIFCAKFGFAILLQLWDDPGKSNILHGRQWQVSCPVDPHNIQVTCPLRHH